MTMKGNIWIILHISVTMMLTRMDLLLTYVSQPFNDSNTLVLHVEGIVKGSNQVLLCLASMHPVLGLIHLNSAAPAELHTQFTVAGMSLDYPTGSSPPPAITSKSSCKLEKAPGKDKQVQVLSYPLS
jgi:hypothetical protein